MPSDFREEVDNVKMWRTEGHTDAGQDVIRKVYLSFKLRLEKNILVKYSFATTFAKIM